MTASTCPLTAYRSIRSWLAGDPPIIRHELLARRLELLAHAPGDVGEEHVVREHPGGRLRQDQRHRVRALGDEAAGGLVRHVAELGDRALDRVPDVRGDRQRAVDDARDRGAGDPGQRGHALQRRAAPPSCSDGHTSPSPCGGARAGHGHCACRRPGRAGEARLASAVPAGAMPGCGAVRCGRAGSPSPEELTSVAQTVQGVVARGKGEPVALEHDRRPRSRARRGGRAGPGLRGVPHRPALPRGRHQRRLPVPARPRGGRRRRGVGDGRHRGRARRLRDPQLARGLRRVPGLPARPPVVLLRHPQRRPADDARGRHRALAPRSASAPSPRRRSCTPGQCTKVDPAAQPGGRRPARLRRDGRARRGDQHRRRRARRHRGGDRLRRRRQRRGRRAPGWPARRTIIAVDVDDRKLELGDASLGATHTVNASDGGRRRGGPGAHRRLRRRRRHRGGRPPGDVQAGVLRPRPRRHRRARRRADPGHAPGAAAARRLRPRRRAEVALVRRLPAVARLPDAGRPATCRAGSTWTRSSPRRSASATSRRRSTKMHRGEVLRSVVVF